MAYDPIDDWHPQDWLIIAQVLSRWIDEHERPNPRQNRAQELLISIQIEMNMPFGEIQTQIESDWNGVSQKSEFVT